MRTVALAIAALAGGCATEPVIPAKLEPPSVRLLSPAKALPEVKAGDDLVKTAAVCRAEYGRETGKLTGLQSYVKTILKK
jgi:hypothetical protein